MKKLIVFGTWENKVVILKIEIISISRKKTKIGI